MEVKRLFDLFAACLALIVLSPLILLAAVGVLVMLGRPVFFIQTRPGHHGKPFDIYKLRTMLQPTSATSGADSDAERMTSFGRFLRRTSLDELPELWNVIRGDMSLVGPRPLLMEYLELYSPSQARRHEVRPGITGWAQVEGRNSLSWEEKFDLDVWYVDNRSMWLDLMIMLLTVFKVLKKEDISQDGQATMTKFLGSKQ